MYVEGYGALKNNFYVVVLRKNKIVSRNIIGLENN